MLLSIEDLRKSYPGPEGPAPVLRGVTLSLEAGETLALTGESGSGKSTLLHLVAGLDAADGGRVMLDGHEVTALDDSGRARVRRSAVGIVFQQFNLIPSLDVAANIAFQARLTGAPEPRKLSRLAGVLGLEPHLQKYPEQLSGGQQQRVAIARALAARPKLILADEPTGNLDPATSDVVFEALKSLIREEGAAALIATHNFDLARRANRIVTLRNGLIEDTTL